VLDVREPCLQDFFDEGLDGLVMLGLCGYFSSDTYRSVHLINNRERNTS
jgi:hypothetical protein